MKNTTKFARSRRYLSIAYNSVWSMALRALRQTKNWTVTVDWVQRPMIEIPPVRELRYDLGPAYAYLKPSNSKDAWLVLGRVEDVHMEGAR